ncbi:cystathionine beta-lyase [Glacieibacterium frigidum]|uniref:Cystathionine beta-lyase n=1 Tax=Glacieibacterium frigidum TaxID=2593303 RepID=A0A552UIV8_9SPHN|nr:cystathionine beta-lyase [Glacieibacterium frigidum]TRW18147.1 cystathionine beta-lyase [Glacieibacterium frigidum]
MTGPNTRIVHAGRNSDWTHGRSGKRGVVNTPIYRASTVLFESLAELDAANAAPDRGLNYGARGTPSQWALEEALTELDPGAAGTRLYPTGLAALAIALMTVADSGDHVLITDSAYDPTRLFADRVLKRMGIAVTYYDPLIGAGIEALVQPNTRAILLESPGSLTFEVQDVPAIVAVAKARGLATILDNTWATPLLLPSMALGIDLSMQALTKYVGGHADVLVGSVSASPAWWPRLSETTRRFGQYVSPDDCALCLRGLRTMALRLRQHEANALEVAGWLQTHPAVERVIHPALPGDPGYALWKRDFKGASGLFAFTLKQGTRADTGALIDDLAHFGIGFSWGGFESLVLPVEPNRVRTATQFEGGALIRVHIGLEDPADLIADLDAGLARYTAQF